MKRLLQSLAVTWLVFLPALPGMAEVIIYDNSDGTFWWRPYESLEDNHFLDPTQPPTQSGELGSSSLISWHTPAYSMGAMESASLQSLGELEIAAGETYVLDPYFPDVTAPQLVIPGTTIGPDATWVHEVCMIWRVYDPTNMYYGVHQLVSPYSFIGFRTGAEGQYHYGWIELQQRVDYQFLFDPVRWAYETEINTPVTVTIPEPATASSLLVVAAAIAYSRRLRTD